MAAKPTTHLPSKRKGAASKARLSSKIEDKEQYERFRQFARDHGVDESTEAFDEHFKKAVRPKATS